MTPRDTRYKAFPPGWSNIQVPTHSKAATLAGIATYTPCGPTGVWGQRVAWTLAKLGGARLLPGRGRSWDPPFATDSWQTLLRELAAAAGPFDSHTVYERRRGRRGLLMLLLDGDRPVGFVKAAEEDPPGIAREEEALLAAERVGVDSFLTPRVLGSGLIAGWRYVVASPMPPLMHRMLSQAPEEAILEDIALVLADIERPADAPSHWQPFHGDFAPCGRHLVPIGSSMSPLQPPSAIRSRVTRWSARRLWSTGGRKSTGGLARSSIRALPSGNSTTD
jgi:hypothetical protein